MADQVMAKTAGGDFESHDEGQFVGQCVDVISLGEEVSEFPGKPKKLVPKVAFVYRTGEKNTKGDYIDLVAEYTVSLGDLANLRKFLEQWRGKPLTPQQVAEGVPLEKMEGTWALLTVAHKESKKGRTYAIIVSAVGVPKQMLNNLPKYPAYERPKYLLDKKAKNATDAAAFRAEIGAPSHGDTGPTEPEDGFLQKDDDSELPF
jgi:hypothetical protein